MSMLPAKPIVMAKIYHEVAMQDSIDDEGVKTVVIHMMQKRLEKKFDDYHVLVVTHDKREDGIITLETFYPKDFTEINYQELKGKIEAEFELLKKEHEKKEW
jgi:hypothetical protein